MYTVKRKIDCAISNTVDMYLAGKLCTSECRVGCRNRSCAFPEGGTATLLCDLPDPLKVYLQRLASLLHRHNERQRTRYYDDCMVVLAVGIGRGWKCGGWVRAARHHIFASGA